MNDHATHNPMQTHLDAFNAAHPDQQTAHLQGEHGWIVRADERTGRTVLLAMHAVAHPADAVVCPDHGVTAVTATYIYTGHDGGCSWAFQAACGCFITEAASCD